MFRSCSSMYPGLTVFPIFRSRIPYGLTDFLHNLRSCSVTLHGDSLIAVSLHAVGLLALSLLAVSLHAVSLHTMSSRAISLHVILFTRCWMRALNY